MLRAVTLATAVVAMTTSCARLSPDEELVGTWLYTGMDSFARITFTRDHLVLFCFPEAREQPCDPKKTAHGTWRIRGEEVVCSINYSQLTGEPPHSKEEKLP